MRVQFFASCLVELLRPEVASAAQRVLRAAGYDPQPVRRATCCGQPAYNAGYGNEARRVARRTLRALGNNETPCVVASGSCATMISHHWPQLFDGTADAGAARRAAARTVELTAFVTNAGNPTDDRTELPQDSANAAETVLVHDSCHALRELGAGTTVRQALRDAGKTPISAEGAERCCGFGGSFSVKMPGVSIAMADEKLDNLLAADSSQVTSCDLSCLLHLQGRARRRGLELQFDHVATLLDPGHDFA